MAADDPFPAWDQPATKADVLRAMIWTQGLVVSLFTYVNARQGTDVKAIREALDRYDKESQEYSRIISEIGGRETNG
jgi:glycyl-tRNA synthetase alpha subunit